MSGFFVSNTLGTFHSKKAETVKPKVFTAETSGTGLSQITASDTFKEIWASKPKSDQNLHDFYQLRGEICSEPNLFSDDRDDLLDLLASKLPSVF